MIDHEQELSHDMLDNLINKSKLLLEENKQPLLQVLRYRDEWWFVPQEIEEKVKHQVKNFHNLEPLEDVIIIPRTTSFDQYWSHREISYQWKTYEDLMWSWNTYNHTISQYKQIEQRTLQDVKAWLLTNKESKMLLALNYIHDIVEKYKWDVVQNKKTEEQRSEEWNLTHQIIDEQNRTVQEKDFMKYIFSKDHKKSLFKLYERMMYIIDIKHLIDHENKYNNSRTLVWYLLSNQFPRFLESFEFLDGTVLPAYEIESFKRHFSKYRDTITQAFELTKDSAKSHHSYPWYEEAKRIWENILLLKIYS